MAETKEQAIKILNYLNKSTGKKFRENETTLKPIISRLKQGFTMADCMNVIDMKKEQWGSKVDMIPYLRPSTLFGATNFNNYIGDLALWLTQKK